MPGRKVIEGIQNPQRQRSSLAPPVGFKLSQNMPAAQAAELHRNLERKRNYQTSHMGFTVVLDLNLQLEAKVGFSS